ncbi:MAG: tRNA (adenosine(37)-N6)-threonylcarbamoyltransferase complex dimerization subunit type 1 TsaB [Solirubrobacteraceae bacterium]
MLILGLDTATRATTVTLMDTAGAPAVQLRDDPPRGQRPRHTTRLMALVVQTLADAGRGWADLDRIAVGTGPGTFTGLRIGVSTARALAAARGLPLVGVSTLHALALGAGAAAVADGREVLAVLDARRGEAFAAGWAAEHVLGPVAPPLLPAAALAPDALAQAAAAAGCGWLAVGEGAIEFREFLERSGGGRVLIPEDDSELHRVSAIDHCRLAMSLIPQDPEDVRPEYLRLADAELSLRARQP